MRVYDRGTNSPVLAFDVAEGSIGEEGPFDAITPINITPASTSPTLPWDTTNMANVPADGSFDLTVRHAFLDFAAKVSGSSITWVDFEVWYTAEYGS